MECCDGGGVRSSCGVPDVVCNDGGSVDRMCEVEYLSIDGFIPKELSRPRPTMLNKLIKIAICD